MPTASNVIAGPGTLYAAPSGTTLPTDATSSLGSAFAEIGYTEDGSSFTYETTTEAVYVAESLEAVRNYTTQVTARVTFQMAEASNINLILALNQGVTDTTDPTYDATAAITPAAPGAEVRIVLVLDSDNDSRWVFPVCYQTGSLEVARRKAPQKTVIPVEFTLETPGSGSLFTCYPNSTGLV